MVFTFVCNLNINIWGALEEGVEEKMSQGNGENNIIRVYTLHQRTDW
jgi:hypothetical protein